MTRKRLIAAITILLLLLLGIQATKAATTPPPPKEVSISQAVTEIKAGKIAKASINDVGSSIELTRTKEAGGQTITSLYPSSYASELTQALLSAKVSTQTKERPAPNPLLDIFVGLLPIFILVGLMVVLMRSDALTGGIGRFRGKRGQQLGEVPTTRFSDVAGCDEAVAELTELVEFLKDGDRFAALGAKAPRGALLVGPPGTGKTLLARAVAGEAGVPFFAVAGSDFIETFAGVGARRARDLFDRARAAGKAIIFIDEIDAVGKARGGGPSHGGESERENTLISMLNEMDGFEGREVIVLAATNRADVLDPALTRPGRLDRQVQVPNPDRRGRTAILKVHTAGRPLKKDVDLVSVARQTPGMSGAELAQVVNEACMEAARRGRSKVSQDCFQSAIATIAMGRARTSALVTEHDKRITAWHEGGHTVAALMLEHADDPASVTIVPRGVSGGTTWMSGNDNSFTTRLQAHAQLVVAMAGRAGEEVLLEGEFTQGAAGDLQHATALARQMVGTYGMTGFGYALIDDDSWRVGGQLGDQAHAAVDQLLRAAHEQATELLAVNADLLAAVAARLLEDETIGAARLAAMRAEHLERSGAGVPLERERVQA